LITTKFNNDYSIDNKDKEAIEHILSDYKRVLKENEELNLKYYMLYTGKIENLKAQEVKIKSQVIPVQKVKAKIEEYKNMLKTCNKVKDIDRIKAINERILELEELLEGRK
jgi:translation initiation factor 2 beta subunit (eIF-2beta)/eIF-5